MQYAATLLLVLLSFLFLFVLAHRAFQELIDPLGLRHRKLLDAPRSSLIVIYRIIKQNCSFKTAS